MAADVDLLDAVTAGAPPTLRLYRWSPPAVSLGRFQPDDDVDRDACVRLGVDVVRRPTGGKALLHGGDLTYAVALPRPPGRAGSVRAVYELLAGALITGLAELGVAAAVARHDGPGTGPVCFAAQQGADLRVGERKLCGSAQTRTTAAVLQHGSILLRRLPFDETDLLLPPGDRRVLHAVTATLEELGAPTEPERVGGALVHGFRQALDVQFSPRPAVG
jgi:lipoyl(octanoyl) transferase